MPVEVLRRRQGHQQRRHVEHLHQGPSAGRATLDTPRQGNVSPFASIAEESGEVAVISC